MSRLSPNKPTQNQLFRLNQIRQYLGENRIAGYLNRKGFSYSCLTKNQAQRIIMDLGRVMPTRVTQGNRKKDRGGLNGCPSAGGSEYRCGT